MLKFAAGHVGVDLRSLKRFVAEKLLHAAEVGSVVEHVGGKAVAYRVGRQARGVGVALQLFFHEPLHQGGIKVASVGAGEEASGWRCRSFRVAAEPVCADCIRKLGSERNQSFLITLAEHF